MQQLSLGLGILPQITQTSTYDPHWDEITQQDDSVSGQPLNLEPKIENPNHLGDKVSGQSEAPGDDCPPKSVSGHNENSDVKGLSAIKEKCAAPGDGCPLTIQAGNHVIDDKSEISKISKLSKLSKLSNNSCLPTDIPQNLQPHKLVSGKSQSLDGEELLQPHKLGDGWWTIQVGDHVGLGIRLGTVLSIEGRQATVEVHHPLGNFEVLSDLKHLELFSKQPSPCESVSGQVNNTTAHQHKFTGKTVGGQVNNTTNGVDHQHNGWVEKYSVPKNGHKYYYWRFAWREGTKKRRKYLGSCTSPEVKEKVEMVKSAIALGKLPHEIMGLI